MPRAGLRLLLLFLIMDLPGCYPAGSGDRHALLKAEERVEALESSLARDPQNHIIQDEVLSSLQDLGALYLDQGLLETALRTFQKILKVDGRRPGALRGVATASDRLGEPLQAREAAKAAAGLEPNSLPTWILLGDISLRLGDVKGSLEAYQQGLALDPGSSACLNGIGRAYSRNQLDDVACRYFESALTKNPGSLHIAANLAEAYLKLQDAPRAIPLYERLVKEGYQDPGLFIRLGHAYNLAGQHDKARALLIRAQDLSVDPPPLLKLFLAHNFVESREYGKAQALLLDHELQASAYRTGANLSLASIHIREKRWEEALRLLRGLELETGLSSAETYALYRFLGDLERGRGEHRKALDSYLRAAQVEGSERKLLAPLGVTCLALGDISTALEYFQQSIRFGDRLSPEEEAAYRAALETSTARQTHPEEPSFKLVDVTARAGITFTYYTGFPLLYFHQEAGSGVTVFDYDGDGDEDLFLTNSVDIKQPPPFKNPPGVSPHCALYRNEGDGTFTDVTGIAGLALPMPAHAACTPDVDQDGYPDLVISGIGLVRVYLNRGDGTFVPAPERVRAQVPRYTVYSAISFADLDRDGFLDAYVSSYNQADPATLAPRPPLIGYNDSKLRGPSSLNPVEVQGEPDLLLHNEGGTALLDVTSKALGAAGAAIKARTFLAVMADFRNTGWPDIFTSNDSQECQFYVNRGGMRFDNKARSYWVGDSRANMGMAVADYDDDGDLDLFVTHWCRQNGAFFRNEYPRPVFTDVAVFAGLAKTDPEEVGWGVQLADLDQDGILDLFYVNGHTQAESYREPTCYTTDKNLFMAQAPQVFKGLGRRFVNVSAAVGLGGVRWIGRSTAAFDYDGDGDLDVMVGNNSQPSILLENQGLHGAYLRIILAGTRSNRQGVGARAYVRSGGKTRMREILMGTSYLAQESLSFHVGLGPADRVEELSVRWPSGVVKSLRDLPVNRTIRMVEPD